MSIPFYFGPIRLRCGVGGDVGLVDGRQVANRVESTFDIAMASLQTLLGAREAYHLDDERVTERTIFVDTMHTSAVEFGIDRATQEKPYTNGRFAMVKFLSKKSLT